MKPTIKQPSKVKVVRASKQRSVGLFDEVCIVRVQVKK